MRKAFRRLAVDAPSRQKAKNYTFPPPVRGLVLTESAVASAPGGALVLDNWFPTQKGARLRGGSKRAATIGTTPVRSMITYSTASSKRLFAASDIAMFDITDVLSVTVPPVPVITGQTNGYYSFQQFATPGGEYLCALNGYDKPLLFDGSTWLALDATTTPAISGAGLDTRKLIHVWSFKNRLFFIERGSMNAWYLEVDSIGGLMHQVSLAGVFQKGGFLMSGATWSLDTGSGLDDQCVFISSEGEIAIYQGTDPSSATSWAIKGRYDVTPPMGRRCLMSAGGDLLIGTKDGIVPLSEVLAKDSAALTLSAVTRNIEPGWKTDVLLRADQPWEILKWPSQNMAIVGIPPVNGISPYCWVVNLQTGAWARFTGWQTQCLALHKGKAYFGTPDGKILLAEEGGTDDGAIYTSVYVGLPDNVRSIAAYKQVHSARATFSASQPFTAQTSVATNYSPNLPSPPSVPSDAGAGGRWDIGLWDVALWDVGGITQISTRWASIGRSGLVVLPQIQVTNGAAERPDAEIIAFDVLYEVGGIMV